ncbi:hypothetical protein Dda_5481 [Drechslerella dactyloides]|uniref:Uncharacterized protein n=1 Tax=Drechslerella dactyloides TaxID=74499 RepID=A0AAD6NIS0_DREDA|nr:hypothetical protein Dda_5481 [Drechslerella dactyloides]
MAATENTTQPHVPARDDDDNRPRQSAPRTSYLLSYLNKQANLSAADVPKYLDSDGPAAVDLPGHDDEGGPRLSFDGSNFEDYYTAITGLGANVNRTLQNDDDDADVSEEPAELPDEDYDDEDEDLSDEEDPDELTNLPYKSPAVYQLPGPGNGSKFRTLVRDGPLGTAEGEAQRFVVIGKRSFRGAGLYPRDLVREAAATAAAAENDEDDVEMQGVDDGNEDFSAEDEEDYEAFEGEVELMCSAGGEQFWLVRDPTDDGSVGQKTSWVAKEWFLELMRRRAARRKEVKVDLRVAMEEDTN